MAYVRCELPARALGGNVTQLSPESLYDTPDGVRIRDQGEACVWSIPGSRTEGRMLEAIRAMGIPALVDVDDNYTVLYDGDTDWVRGINPDDYRSIEAHALIVRHQASGVICATEKLADIYRRQHENVHVAPNCVDPADWPPDPWALKTGSIKVGFAGSVSHVRDDLPLVRRALRAASARNGVEAVTLGHGMRAWDFPHLHIPWTDTLADYRLDLCMLDIGLCPLKETSWSVGKSDLKVLEYAMAGALPVVSRAEPFRDWFDIVPTCRSAAEFERTVLELLSDSDSTRARAREVRERVLAERSIYGNAWRWEEAIRSCA